jgi:hypothetical protein
MLLGGYCVSLPRPSSNLSPNSCDPFGEGLEGGVWPGWYSLMTQKLRRGNKWVLFLLLPSTSRSNIGIMSLLRLFSTSAIITGGGVFTIAELTTLGMYR